MIMVWNSAHLSLMSSIRMKKLLNIAMSEIHHNKIELHVVCFHKMDY
jgi:hypothetical protein